MNNKNIIVNVVNGIGKSSGKKYKAIQLEIKTSAGVWKAPLIFPTPLEMSVLEKSLMPIDVVNKGETSPFEGELGAIGYEEVR